MWTCSYDVDQLVVNAWKTWIPGTPIFIWEKKLKMVKLSLKHWEKASFNTPTMVKQELLEKLDSLQLNMDESEISENLQQELKL